MTEKIHQDLWAHSLLYCSQYESIKKTQKLIKKCNDKKSQYMNRFEFYDQLGAGQALTIIPQLTR